MRSSRKTNTEEGLPKSRGLVQFADLRGSWQERGGGGGVLGFIPDAHTLCFTSLTTRKIKIFKNEKKTPGDIILHLCTTNDYHMMYGS